MQIFKALYQKEAGFSLIEIMISIVILMIGILGVGAMQIASINGTATASGVTGGMNCGASKAEELLERGLTSYQDANMTDRNSDGVAGLNNATTATADSFETYDRYTIYWNVAADDLLPNTKTVNIIITWRDRNILKSTSLRQVIPEII